MTEHAGKEGVWGQWGRGRNDSYWGIKPIFLLSSHALMVSLVCTLRTVLNTESGTRLRRFSLSSAAWDQSLCDARLSSPLPVLELPP